MITFERGSNVTQFTVLIELIDDDLDEQGIQSLEIRLEVVTAVNSALLNLRDEFTGLIQDNEGGFH